MSQQPEDWSAGPRAPWVVVDTEEYAFVCRRCGERESFPVPVELFDWTERSQLFLAVHLRCRAPKVEATQEAML